jgi:hypothetical protein
MGLMINCKEATYLVDKKFEARIGLNQQVKLKFHLILCKVCATYQNQSLVLNNSFKKSLAEEPNLIFVNELKEKIKARIEN